MVIDSSVLIAILWREPEARRFIDLLRLASTRLLSAATRTETGIVVLVRRGEPGLEELNALLIALRVETVPFTAEHSRLAVAAFQRFGKGRHPAGLNMGDCFSYALAKATGEPLLFKGEDFARTDIEQAR